MPARTPILDKERWNCTAEELAEELRSFVDEMSSFTPEHFAQIKFHLLRQYGLRKESRNEFCEVSIHYDFCPECDSLYSAKECLLWYRLFGLVDWKLLSRAPPCIRSAFRKKSIKTVTNFLTKASLIDPPFYKARSAPSCKVMRRWGYCTEDEYCREMETGSTLEYIRARERVKMNRGTLPG